MITPMKSAEEQEASLARLRKLYPKAKEEDLPIIEDNLDRYVKLAWEIYERLKREGKPIPRAMFISGKGKVDSITKRMEPKS